MRDFSTTISKFEQQRLDLLAFMSAYTHEDLNQKPSATSWSAMQTLSHLMIAEKGVLAYLKKKIADTATTKKAGFAASFRSWALRIFFAIPLLKIKAPKVVADVPIQAISFEEAQNEWHTIRIELIALLSSLPSADLDKELFKHPLAGRMNIYQMIAFFEQHIARHKGQIERALKQLSMNS